MTATWHRRVGVAERCRGNSAIGDFVRVIGEQGNTIAMVNAFECGWSVAFPDGSRWFLDQLASLTVERCVEPLAEARQRFLKFAAQFPGAEADLVGHPAVSYTVAEVVGNQVSIRWLGGDVAVLVRGTADAQVTAPHIIKTEVQRKGVDCAGAPNQGVLTILTRCFGPDSPEITDVGLDEPWILRAGDVLLLMSNQAFHALGEDAVTFLCATIIDPQQLADELADRAFARDLFYSAVHVTRFESVDVPAEIRSAIARYQSSEGFPHAAAYAREHEVLPLSFDPAGMLGVRSSGSMATASWEEMKASKVPVRIDTRLHHARIGLLWRLATVVPSLRELRPRLPARTAVCSRCLNFHEAAHTQTEGCPYCSYTGFELPAVPSELEGESVRPVRYWKTDIEAGDPVRKPWWKFWR